MLAIVVAAGRACKSNGVWAQPRDQRVRTDDTNVSTNHAHVRWRRRSYSWSSSEALNSRTALTTEANFTQVWFRTPQLLLKDVRVPLFTQERFQSPRRLPTR